MQGGVLEVSSIERLNFKKKENQKIVIWLQKYPYLWIKHPYNQSFHRYIPLCHTDTNTASCPAQWTIKFLPKKLLVALGLQTAEQTVVVFTATLHLCAF